MDELLEDILDNDESYGATELLKLKATEQDSAVSAAVDPDGIYIIVDVLVPPGDVGLPDICKVIPFILKDPEGWKWDMFMAAEAEVTAMWVGIVEEVAGEKVPLTALVTNKEPPPLLK